MFLRDCATYVAINYYPEANFPLTCSAPLAQYFWKDSMHISHTVHAHIGNQILRVFGFSSPQTTMVTQLTESALSPRLLLDGLIVCLGIALWRRQYRLTSTNSYRGVNSN